VVAVAYERLSLTRGSKYSDLTWKHLAFWKTGRLGEVIATEGSIVFSFTKKLFDFFASLFSRLSIFLPLLNSSGTIVP